MSQTTPQRRSVRKTAKRLLVRVLKRAARELRAVDATTVTHASVDAVSPDVSAAHVDPPTPATAAPSSAAAPEPSEQASMDLLMSGASAMLTGEATVSTVHTDDEDTVPHRARTAPAAQTPALQAIEEAVVENLQTIYDPEIPVDIYELGLIYRIDVSDAQAVQVTMTLTSPNCPAAQSLPNEVKVKVLDVEGVTDAEVDVVFEPTWTPDMMSEEARLELNL